MEPEKKQGITTEDKSGTGTGYKPGMGMGDKMGTMMKKKMGATCPCGFTFTTPHGEDDAVAVLQNHVSRIHLKDYPNGISRDEAMKEIKEVK